MSKYTLTVKEICEALTHRPPVGYSEMTAALPEFREALFDFSAPFHDRQSLNDLEEYFILHYLTREICFNNVNRWRLALRTRFLEVLPYYDKLIQSVKIDYDPLNEIEINRHHTLDNNFKNDSAGTSSTSSNGHSETDVTDNTLDRYSETPESMVENLLNNSYLTNARQTDNQNHNTQDDTSAGTGSTSANATGSSNDVFNETETGRISGNPAAKLKEYRDSLIKVKQMFSAEFQDLFLTVY